jgi:nucleoside-diphosphate-sugar epimerase
VKIILTGSSGFLGGVLARHWVDAHELYLIEGRKDFSLKLAQAPDADWLVHCGFEVSFRLDAQVIERNLRSARAVSEYFKAGRAGRLLFVSAAGVMGVDCEPHPHSEAFLGLTSPGFEAYRNTAYIQAKLECEKLFRAANIPLTVVYPSTVFGTGMPAETLNSLVRGAICPPGGTSFLALRDFLSALDKVIAAPAVGEGYILNGGNLLFRELFSAARSGASARKGFVVLPRATKYLAKAAELFLGGQLLSLPVIQSAFGYKYYSAEKFRQAFIWQPVEDAVEALYPKIGKKKGAR